MRTHAPQPRLSLLLITALVSVVALSGCYSRLTGNAGKFTFGYLTDVEIENFNKPMAPGARLDLVAFKNGSDDDQYRVVSATSSNPKVLSVVSTNARHATVEGIAPGSARISMTVRRTDGTTLEDAVFMSVAKPTRLELAHSCTDTPKAAYVAADTFSIPFSLGAEDGRSVVGYRYVPVDVAPKGALKFLGRPRQFSTLIFEAGPPTQDAQIRSKVDGTTLPLRLVRRSDVDQIRPEPRTLQTMTAVGYDAFVGFQPMAGHDPVCQSGLLTEAKSLTPEICEVSADLDQDGNDWNRSQLAWVKGVGFGICRYEIRFPEASGGQGLAASFSIPVGKFPDADSEAEGPSATRPTGDHQDTGGGVPWYFLPFLMLLGPAAIAPWVWWRFKR